MAKNLAEKIPPQNIDAEKSLLGCLMLSNNAIVKIVDFIWPSDFYRKSHQEIYKTCQELFEKREAIDILSVANRLKENSELEEVGGNSYLTELVNSVPTATNILHYAKIIQKKRILRDLIETGSDVAVMGYDETNDPDVLIDQAEKKIFSIAQRGLSQGFVLVKDSLEEAFERIDKLSKYKGGLRGLATGFTALDNILAGLQKSDLVVLASRPSMGKSAMALNIASHVAINEKIPVGIFSLEMSKDQLVDRLIADQAGIDLWRLRTGKLSAEGDDNDFSRIQHAMGVLSEAPIYIYDMFVCNILQMRAMARRLQAEKGLGLIVVDYLQLMEPRNVMVGEVQQMTEISRSLKSLAKELNIPVLALSQLSRAVEQRSPQIPRLSDLRQSGCLAGDTLLTRADTGERIKIQDLVKEKNIPIYTLDNNLKLKVGKISKVFSSGQKQLYLLKTKSGFEIKASANHPFRKLDGWFALENLKIGDRITTPRKLSPISPKNTLSDYEIILLAHLLGDGCVVKNQPIHYTSADKKSIEIISKVAKKLFQIKPRIVKQKNWYHVYLPCPYQLARKKHHPIINWFSSLGLTFMRSWEKFTPQAIFTLDNKKIALFLSHLWSTDGNISEKIMPGRKPSAAIYYATTSERLIKDVKHLLLRFGIRSAIRKQKKENYRICYQVHIQGKEHQLKFLKEIGAFGEKSKLIPLLIKNLENIDPNTNLDVVPKEIWQTTIDRIREDRKISWNELWTDIYDTRFGGKTALLRNGIGTERLQKIANYLVSPELSNLADSDIFWDEIISITPLGFEEVYDATVPNTHNFVANDIIVHNSIEQDSDVVLFIYRQDRYREDSTKKNIAEIIIAKHRNGPVGKIELFFDESRVAFRNLEKGFQEE